MLQLVALAFLALAAQPSPVTAARPLASTADGARVSADSSATSQEAATYLDGLFSNVNAARSSLAGSFVKRHRVAVLYMCYDEPEVISAALSAVLNSEELEQYDLIVSQDGGSSAAVNVQFPADVNHLSVHHPVNLGADQHLYFAMWFAFSVMSYESIIIIKQDNIVHPQAVQILDRMLSLTVGNPYIGLASINEHDTSILLNEQRYSAAVMQIDAHAPVHLRVYGIHASRYIAVQSYLAQYYEASKVGSGAASASASSTSSSSAPSSGGPDRLFKLLRSHGLLPSGAAAAPPPSLESFLLSMLAKERYARRIVTLVRLFRPLDGAADGGAAAALRSLPEHYSSSLERAQSGDGMFEGEVNSVVWDVAEDFDDLADLRDVVRGRLNALYERFTGRKPEPTAVREAMKRLLQGRADGTELVRSLMQEVAASAGSTTATTGERRERRMRELVAAAGSGGAAWGEERAGIEGGGAGCVAVAFAAASRLRRAIFGASAL